MKTKTLKLSIGTIFLAGLIGCGGGSGGDSNTPPTTTNPPTTEDNSSKIKVEQDRLLESGVALPSLYGEDIPAPTKPMDINETIHIPDGLTFHSGIDIHDISIITVDMTEFLIITHQDFKDALEPLKAHKEKMGIPTKIVTWQELVEKFDGVDNPEKIKKGIASYINNLKYVMLVGDADKFPTRYCRCYDNVNWGDGWAPIDLYYADIFDENKKFATWDSNNNGKFCETVSAMSNPDGTYMNRDRILKSGLDVVVGRLPASNAEEVTNYVNKVISYEDGRYHSWHYTDLMLVPGNDKKQDSYPYSSNLKDSVSYQILQQSVNSNGERNIIKMYHNLDRDKIIDSINQGVGFVNYAGHGASTFWYFDKTSNNSNPYFGKYAIDSLQNEDKYPIVFSVACDTGKYNYDKVYETKDGSTFDLDKNCPYKPKEGIQGCLPAPKADPNAKYAPEPSTIQTSDYLDSMAEEFLVKNPNSGAIAFIGSTGATQTPAQAMDRYFSSIYADSIYDNSKNPTIGRLGDVWLMTLDMFKNNNVNLDEKVSKDWKKEMNFAHLLKYHLFGDPSLLLPHNYDTLIK